MSDADTLLAAWGGGTLRLVSLRENAVHEAHLADGRHVALRLHRAGYQDAAAIRSELIWARGLADAGLAVPAPVATLAGDLVHRRPDGRLVSAVTWLPGRPLGAAHEPLSGPRAGQVARFHAIGALLADLHNTTDRLPLPDDFTRPAWDSNGLLGAAPLWGRFWDNPALTNAERARLLAARDIARDRLAAHRASGADYGLIHADLMRENILIDGQNLALIDFDDSGFGYRLYDLATLMLQNLDEPAYPALRDAALAGYRTRRPLGDDHAALLPMFVMLRCFASCGWAVPRLAPGDPQLRRYAERALREAAIMFARE